MSKNCTLTIESRFFMKRHIVLCLLAMFVFATVCIVSPKKSVSASQQPKSKVSLDTEDGIVYVRLDTESCALKRLCSETAFVGKLESEEAIAKIPKVDNTLIKAEGSGNIVIISSGFLCINKLSAPEEKIKFFPFNTLFNKMKLDI